MTPAELREGLASIRMSQRAFAIRIGASPNTVNRWAQGALPVPAYVPVIIGLIRDVQELRGVA